MFSGSCTTRPRFPSAGFSPTARASSCIANHFPSIDFAHGSQPQPRRCRKQPQPPKSRKIVDFCPPPRSKRGGTIPFSALFRHPGSKTSRLLGHVIDALSRKFRYRMGESAHCRNRFASLEQRRLLERGILLRRGRLHGVRDQRHVAAIRQSMPAVREIGPRRTQPPHSLLRAQHQRHAVMNR